MDNRIQECIIDDAAVRIGVVGHRMNRLTLENAKHLEDPIRSVLEELATIRGPAVRLQVVTSLAEGADRIFAREAVRRDMLETVVLPFSRERFELDCSTEESKREFRELLSAAATIIEPRESSGLNAEEGYRQASAVVIACADVLAAIWDGEPGRGPGGTAHTIGSALVQDIPVIWIRSSEPYSIEVIEPEGGIEVSPLSIALERIRSRAPGPSHLASSTLAKLNLHFTI